MAASSVDLPTGYGAGIIIRLRSQQETATFDVLVKEALQTIASQPIGKRLLDGISREVGKAQFGYTVCIMRPKEIKIEIPNDANFWQDFFEFFGIRRKEPGVPRWNAGNVAVRISEDKACNGEGTPTAITWNPNIITTPDGSRPPFIGLAHELIHAFYNLRGEAYAGARDEELRTVGLTEGRGITENMIRAEHNIPLRTAYTGLDN